MSLEFRTQWKLTLFFFLFCLVKSIQIIFIINLKEMKKLHKSLIKIPYSPLNEGKGPQMLVIVVVSRVKYYLLFYILLSLEILDSWKSNYWYECKTKTTHCPQKIKIIIMKKKNKKKNCVSWTSKNLLYSFVYISLWSSCYH